MMKNLPSGYIFDYVYVHALNTSGIICLQVEFLAWHSQSEMIRVS